MIGFHNQNTYTINEDVTLTGMVDDAERWLVLNIATGKTVTWDATYTDENGNVSFSGDPLVCLSNNGKMDMIGGMIWRDKAGVAIQATGESAAVVVCGIKDWGVSVYAETGNAIIMKGDLSLSLWVMALSAIGMAIITSARRYTEQEKVKRFFINNYCKNAPTRL